MFTHLLFLSAAFTFNAATPLVGVCPTTCVAVAPVGGPPSVRLAKKAKGDITAAEWKGVRDVDLAGCVPDARITLLTFCIKDCTAREASLSTTSRVLTTEMRAMIQNLPSGTSFTVKVEVKDSKGREWTVPPAQYVWRG